MNKHERGEELIKDPLIHKIQRNLNLQSATEGLEKIISRNKSFYKRRWFIVSMIIIVLVGADSLINVEDEKSNISVSSGGGSRSYEPEPTEIEVIAIIENPTEPTTPEPVTIPSTEPATEPTTEKPTAAPTTEPPTQPPTQPPTPTPTEPPTEKPKHFIVFWGHTGNKMHISPTCRTITNEVLSGTYEEAFAFGRDDGWCKACRRPIGWGYDENDGYDKWFFEYGNPNID
ncbi:MAG: hypothetical protein FWH10_00030 [Oscillospiraceae bacterium]|nr:hypothetical protein [Oscillospiraceae bacterium]